MEMDVNVIQDVRERLVKIETLLEQQINMVDLKNKELEKRVEKLEGYISWLWKIVGGSIVTAILGVIIKIQE